VKAAAHAEMPDRQLWSAAVGGARRQIAGIVQEALQESIDRETLVPGFRRQTGFGLQRDDETHRVVLLFLAYRMSAGEGMGAGGANAFEQDGGGFAVGVLGDQFAFEGFLEDGLAKTGGTGERSIYPDARVELPPYSQIAVWWLKKLVPQ